LAPEQKRQYLLTKAAFSEKILSPSTLKVCSSSLDSGKAVDFAILHLAWGVFLFHFFGHQVFAKQALARGFF
jgi:hypothetical protein